MGNTTFLGFRVSQTEWWTIISPAHKINSSAMNVTLSPDWGQGERPGSAGTTHTSLRSDFKQFKLGRFRQLVGESQLTMW